MKITYLLAGKVVLLSFAIVAAGTQTLMAAPSKGTAITAGHKKTTKTADKKCSRNYCHCVLGTSFGMCVAGNGMYNSNCIDINKGSIGCQDFCEKFYEPNCQKKT